MRSLAIALGRAWRLLLLSLAVLHSAGCKIESTPIGVWEGAGPFQSNDAGSLQSNLDAASEGLRPDASMGGGYSDASDADRLADPDAPLSSYDGGGWSPTVSATWQWQLSGAIDTTTRYDAYELDLFGTSPQTIAAVHALGSRAICYVSMGVAEPSRPDASQFPPSYLGNDHLSGRSVGRWFDFRRLDVLGSVLRARLDLCKSKGFDGIDPDDIDGWLANTGLSIVEDDQLIYDTWLAIEAHARGLAIGLHNDQRHYSVLQPQFDWVVAERCFFEGWCSQLTVMTSHLKPAFAVEYTEDNVDFGTFCAMAVPDRVSGVSKHRNLDAFRQPCP